MFSEPSANTEANEYKGSALLGMAQDHNDQFVFVVQPAFKEWLRTREKPYLDQNIHFATVAEMAPILDRYTLIWPERPRQCAEKRLVQIQQNAVARLFVVASSLRLDPIAVPRLREPAHRVMIMDFRVARERIPDR